MISTRGLAALLGVVYALFGLAGFLVSTDQSVQSLLGFDVNLAANITDLVIGAIALAAVLVGANASKLAAQVLGALFLVMTLAGFAGQPFLGFIPLGGADLLAHAVSLVLCAISGLATFPRKATA
ncbi:MAG: DUF4383 domain-containing protein [Candidatus Dormibacteria bacterium]